MYNSLSTHQQIKVNFRHEAQFCSYIERIKGALFSALAESYKQVVCLPHADFWPAPMWFPTGVTPKPGNLSQWLSNSIVHQNSRRSFKKYKH